MLLDGVRSSAPGGGALTAFQRLALLAASTTYAGVVIALGLVFFPYWAAIAAVIGGGIIAALVSIEIAPSTTKLTDEELALMDEIVKQRERSERRVTARGPDGMRSRDRLEIVESAERSREADEIAE